MSSAKRVVPVNAFCSVASSVIEFAERMVLPASPASVPTLRSGLPVREKLADVDAVLLTQAHPDHTGSAGGSCARSHAGSAALLFEDRGVLVTGDVLATENGLTGRIGPQIMPDGLNEDGAQALASLDALLGIDADLLLPGHGDPWTGA